jgi:hypothetical protein
MKSVSSKRLYQYWQDLSGDRPAPERRDIEPAAIKSLLSDVFILEHRVGSRVSPTAWPARPSAQPIAAN